MTSNDRGPAISAGKIASQAMGKRAYKAKRRKLRAEYEAARRKRIKALTCGQVQGTKDAADAVSADKGKR